MIMSLHKYILFIFIGVSFQQTFAQVGHVERWHLGAGVTFAASPDEFYDYWKQGFQVVGGAEFSSQTRYFQFITAEIDYFAFDKQRFLQRIGLENSNIPISGAGTYIFALSYLIRYPFIEYQSYRPTFFAGVGCEDIFRSTANIEYPNFPVTQESYNSIVATVPLGGSIMVFQSGDKAIELNFTYTFGFPKHQKINSNFTCLKFDYSFSE
jgi:hypothetical protein